MSQEAEKMAVAIVPTFTGTVCKLAVGSMTSKDQEAFWISLSSTGNRKSVASCRGQEKASSPFIAPNTNFLQVIHSYVKIDLN